MRHSAHKYHDCYHGFCMNKESISISVLIVIGTAIIGLSMLLAVVIVAVRDARAGRVSLHKDEEGGLLDDDEPLPPYEYPPPAYVAELDAGVEVSSSDPANVEFQGASVNGLL